MAERLNLGIVAHVDAGKTTLTERFLFAAGLIRHLGSVDAGTTQTDSLELERRRGITIKAAVATFEVGGVEINLIDTPGHPDFIAEVERSLAVLDGVVLVVSAVEGVQPQTRVLYRALGRLGIPSLVFINKIDRMGADPDRVLADLEHRLGMTALAMGEAIHPGRREAVFRPHRLDPSHLDYLAAGLDVDGHEVSPEELLARLRARTAEQAAHAVYFGSALTGAGVAELMGGIVDLLPRGPADAEAPLSARVFKIERGRSREKIALVRVFSGGIATRDRLDIGEHRDRVTAIRAFRGGATELAGRVEAGGIAQLFGLAHARVGIDLGLPSRRQLTSFGPPALEAAVVPDHGAERAAVHVALTELAEADPLISLRLADDGQMHVSLFGEVQKEVIRDTLALDYGLAIEFASTTTVYVERPAGTGERVELVGATSNPFNATVGLRIRPGPTGSGVAYTIEAEVGLVPPSFHAVIEEAVRETLGQGLHGWAVTDCEVNLIACAYPTGSTPSDARHLTPMVLMSAMAVAGTVVCEPVARRPSPPRVSRCFAVFGGRSSRKGRRRPGPASGDR